MTFTTCVVACGGSQSQAPTTTSTAVPAPPPTAPPPPPTLPPAPPPTDPPTPPPAPPAPPPTLPAQAPDQLSKAELRDLVAPVALYPDVVLSSLLPATTNPDQVHDAALYVGQSQRVEQVPDDRNWDGSVVGLLQFPDVLRWLDDNPAWTDQMGQAVTYQQGDVLDAIQDYRRVVRNAGNLKSNQYQVVRGEQDIYIEPARPDIVYVPSYDPEVAIQPQPEPGPGINPWIAFGGGAVVGALGAWALYSVFDHDNDVHITNNYYGGRRRIRAYDSYYYARGRRPRPVDWTPRARERRARVEGWQHPHRYQASTRPAQGMRAAPLRPPMHHGGAQAPRPGDIRREQRQERQGMKQENRFERREQKQENRLERREQRQGNRQDRHDQKQENRQEHQMQRQERQQQRHDQREQQQGQRQEQRQQRQGNRYEQRQERQQQQGQRQQQRMEQRQERQGQRQEHQEQRREQRQERPQQHEQQGKKKRNH
jgi:hypothetical protein